MSLQNPVFEEQAKLLSSQTLFFALRDVYETDVQGLFSVEASLTLFTVITHSNGRNVLDHYSDSMYEFMPENSDKTVFAVFGLKGFWSESHGRLCMVGSGSYPNQRSRGNSFRFRVLLKLYNHYHSNNLSSLVTGSLESLVGSHQIDLNHFNPISLMLLPTMNYRYSLVSQALVDFRGIESSANSPLHPMIDSLFSILFSRPLSLKYSSHCRNAKSENCSPFGESHGQFPNIMSLEQTLCDDIVQRRRFLIRFPINTKDIWGYKTLDPKATLVGEGVWDSQKNHLFVVPCRFLNATNSWAEARVSDCSMRMSLRFADIWTIGNNSIIVGRLWSTKSVEDSEYFDEITLELSEGSPIGNTFIKYEYTKLDTAKQWCPKKESVKEKKGKTYPDAFSNEMTFDVFSVRDESHITKGYAQPVAVGNELYSMRWERKSSQNYPMATNISYQINLYILSGQSNARFGIFAEGLYDNSTGSLCMIGCKKIGLNDDTLDCEVVVNFQFPPSDSKLNEGFIKGIIKSMRKKSDPLYFKSLKFSSAAYVASEAKETIRMADWEISLALISNMLAFIFAVFQIFHLRKNPDFRPMVSITMLLTLTFGYAIPLLMDTKSLLVISFESQDVLLGSGGWLEAKAVTEVLTALILILLQTRLIQLSLSARLSHENRVTLRTAEKEVLIVCLPLYLGGAFLSLFVAQSKKSHALATLSSALITSFYENAIWETLRSFTNLLSTSFLLPQILLNMFMYSRGKTLSCLFYNGTTLIKLLPRAFVLYEARNSGIKLVTTLWDLIIPFGSLILAAIVYLQQKFGGRCIIAFRSSESNVYEKIEM